jgi:hypothetical protein
VLKPATLQHQGKVISDVRTFVKETLHLAYNQEWQAFSFILENEHIFLMGKVMQRKM